ncbi:hypothetical protein D3C76_851920 [compost metagenome]
MRLGAGVEKHHVDPPARVVGPDLAEQYPAVGPGRGEGPPAGIRDRAGGYLHFRAHLQLQVFEPGIAEHDARHHGAVGWKGAEVAADGMADQHYRGAADHQHLGEAERAAGEIQRSYGLRPGNDRRLERLPAHRRGAGGDAFARGRQLPFLRYHLALRVEEEDEIQPYVFEHVEFEIFLDVLAIRLGEEFPGLVPPGIDAQEFEIALALEVEPVVENAHLVVETLLVHAVVADEQNPLGQ